MAEAIHANDAQAGTNVNFGTRHVPALRVENRYASFPPYGLIGERTVGPHLIDPHSDHHQPVRQLIAHLGRRDMLLEQ